MSLHDELKAQEALSRQNAPKQVWDENDRQMEKLRLEGLADKSVQVSEEFPAFTLSNAVGHQVSSVELLKQGPLVASFYRGGW